MLRIAFSLCALILASAPAAQAQSDLDRCRAATPEFPQACDCVIAQSEAAGITGNTLSKLLSNDMMGVPMDVFQRYGLIYVQCIQQTLMGSVPGGGGAAPAPSSPAPAQQRVTTLPAPLPPAEPLAATNALAVQSTPFVTYPGPRITMSLTPEREAGRWGNVAFNYDGGGWIAPGVHDGQGHLLALTCQPSNLTTSPHMVLGGLVLAEEPAQAQIRVLRGNGAVLYQTRMGAMPVHGQFALMPLPRQLADAIRAGSTLEITFEDQPPLQFGLRGSNAALGPVACGTTRFAFNAYLNDEIWVSDAAWGLQADFNDIYGADVVTYGVGAPFVPRLELTCDQRFRVGSQIRGYGEPYTAAITVDRFREAGPEWTLRMGVDAPGVSDPLPDDLLTVLSEGEVMTVTFNLDVEPGEFTVIPYRLAGFTDALRALECPAPLGDLPATAAIDLTGQGLTWQAADFGWAFDGMSTNPAKVPGALLQTPDGAPAVNIQCNGEPFTMDEWGAKGPTYGLRITVDADPDTTRDVSFEPRRAQHFPGPAFEGLEARVLAGSTLRVTSLIDPGIDVLYPLDGLRAALADAGCP